MKSIIYIALFFIVGIQPLVFGQPGENSLHFSLVTENLELNEAVILDGYQVNILVIVGRKRLMIQNNKGEINDMTFENNFIVGNGWSESQTIISVLQENEEMWINILSPGVENLSLDSVKFLPGYFKIDVADVLKKKGPGDYSHIGLDITPEKWVSDKKPMLLNASIFPTNFSPWGSKELTLTLDSSKRCRFSKKPIVKCITDITCIDPSGQVFQNQVQNSLPIEKGIKTENGFIINFTHDLNFIVRIVLKKNEEEMIINVPTNGLRRLKLNSIEFHSGTYNLNVAQILKERYEENITESPNYGADYLNHKVYDISPVNWKSIKESN